MWLGLSLLLGLLVFIILDGRRLRSAKADPISREAMTRGFVPRGSVQWQFLERWRSWSGRVPQRRHSQGDQGGFMRLLTTKSAKEAPSASWPSSAVLWHALA
jgi:hypothetical protein